MLGVSINWSCRGATLLTLNNQLLPEVENIRWRAAMMGVVIGQCHFCAEGCSAARLLRNGV